MDDADALAGQTFYREVAGPSAAGLCSYVQLYNPPGSGVRVLVDAMTVWPGLPGASGEVGIIHYATPFNSPGLSGIVTNVWGPLPIVATDYSDPAAKSELFLGNYPGNIEPQIDYIFQGPTSSDPDNPFKFPYPLVFAPGDGIVIWDATPGYELKCGLWLREKPVS